MKKITFVILAILLMATTASANLIPLHDHYPGVTDFYTFTAERVEQLWYDVPSSDKIVVLNNNISHVLWWVVGYNDLNSMEAFGVLDSTIVLVGNSIDRLTFQPVSQRPTATPLPPSVLLLGSGMLGIGLMRRKVR